jgi:hypothetical protein
VDSVEQVKKQKLLIDINSSFVWTSGADAAKIWRRHGWVPPSEYRNDYLFKKNREGEVNDQA